MCSLFWECQHRRIALGMVHNRNKSAIGTCIPDVIGIMFFRGIPQQVAFIISEVSFLQFFCCCQNEKPNTERRNFQISQSVFSVPLSFTSVSLPLAFQHSYETLVLERANVFPTIVAILACWLVTCHHLSLLTMYNYYYYYDHHHHHPHHECIIIIIF